MAQLSKRRAENCDGDFYVDSTCIDCDTCRWMDSTIFSRAGEQSIVIKQPENESERLSANQALLACPTHSIGTVEKNTGLKEAAESFPIQIDGPVYHCGYHSDKSYGATSYFIESDQGNILIDTPRFDSHLVKTLEEKGGVRYLFITHIDDVAEHQKFRDHFQCDRIMHEDDIQENLGEIEWVVEGEESEAFLEEGKIIPVPGHTKGHLVLLYQSKYLFTGDHLAYSLRVDGLAGFERFCFYSWEEQIRSMEKLTGELFEWVLPGHGRRLHCEKKLMREELSRCIEWMKRI